MIKIVIGLNVYYRILLSDFNENLIFSAYLRKILKYQISWKSVHCDRWCSMVSHRQMNCQLVRKTWRKKQPLFVILRMCLKTKKIRDIK